MNIFNKKVCLVGGGVFFLGMILSVLLGVVLKVRFEIVNAIFLIIAIVYAVVLSKIKGDEEVLKNRTILVCSAVAKIIFIFSMVYESELWWSEAAGKDMAFYFYMSFIIFFIFQSIEMVLFYINKIKIFRIYMIFMGLASYLALVIEVNSYWVLIIPIILLTAFSQCNDIKMMTIAAILTSIITMCGSFTQTQYYDTGAYAFITDIPKLLKNAFTNSLREDSEYMFCVYLLIISASVIYAFAMIRITRESKKINDDKIKTIEEEQSKVEKLTEKIFDVIVKVKEWGLKVNGDVGKIDDTLENSTEKLDNISSNISKNVNKIEEQKELTSKIFNLIDIIVNEVEKASEFNNKTLRELEKSKKSYGDLKVWSNQIYIKNKQVMDVVEEFVENVRMVGSITNDINYISDETNLLSFNTYVKSARAGSVGKGFEVVASKIRELSVNIVTLTNDINKIVNKLENDANVLQQVMNDVVENINDENLAIDNTMEDFTNMDNDIHYLSKNVYGITDRVNKMTSFNREIDKNINKLMDLSEGFTEHTGQIATLYGNSKVRINETRNLMKEMLGLVETLEDIYQENYRDE